MTNLIDQKPLPETRAGRGRRAHAAGLRAEEACCVALHGDGWKVLGRRLRTESGEIDIAASKAGLLAIVEVKSGASLAAAAHTLSARQIRRLMAAAEILLSENPGWGQAGVRFDLMLVDPDNTVRRISDAFRLE
jgi:putative endonuclease